MRQFMDITKALGDQTRVRILLMLRDGELCLCQVIEVLNLAPSTISKHVDLLRRAGLIEMRKEGRWHYYRLSDDRASAVVRDALRWVFDALKDEETVTSDAARLCCVREADLKELAECYNRN
ncbi:MAG: winged helix-turn-helix transcriptional regulator [Phycisphaeraceae bacterium]|nr:winged helix-turn-helix transcriptional regulator [Phycisphaeraceae bacterium]